jgi:hypothetical protein
MPSRSKTGKAVKKEPIHNFVLVLSGISEPDGRLEDALYQAGCDDAVLAFRTSVAYLEFDRRAPSLESAILSAVREVESADPRIRVVRVEPGDPVNASEIGRRARLSREYIRLLAQGERGDGGFPAPHSGITGKTLVWSWAEVVRWLSQHDMLEDTSQVDSALTIRDLNDALEVRNDPTVLERRMRFLRRLRGRKAASR